MRRGFTFFEIACAVLVLAIIGMLAIPAALVHSREEEEARAVTDLERIALVEYADRNRSDGGRPRYAWLPELLADYGPRGPRRKAGLSLGLLPDSPPGTGFLRVRGYYFAILLPDSGGRLRSSRRRFPGTSTPSESSFVALAWPVAAGTTGYRAYVSNESLRVWQVDARALGLSGPRPDLARVRHLVAGPIPAHPFRPLLPEEIAIRARQNLKALGLPLPLALRPREHR